MNGINFNLCGVSILSFLFGIQSCKTYIAVCHSNGETEDLMIRSHKTLLVLTLAALAGCTQTVPNQFTQKPVKDSTQAGALVVNESSEEVKTTTILPVDILWVIDNSTSMKPSQAKLKAGLASFAQHFLLKKGTDVQMGVITTDTFIANADAWGEYLDRPVYADAKRAKETPKFFHPKWGTDYARLTADGLMSTTKNRSNLVARFKKQVDVGTDGIYEEHGFDSVLQFLKDNEDSKNEKSHPLFRRGSQRVIVFLSDEDDQSFDYRDAGGSPRKLLYKGSYYTGKDQAVAEKILPAQFKITCESTPAKDDAGQPIFDKNGKAVNLKPMSICIRPGLVTPVETFKSQLDSFFNELDGAPAGSTPKYLVTSIVSKSLKTITYLRSQVPNEITHERGERYIKLADLVGNGSFSMDIGASSYTPILNKIVTEVTKRSTFVKVEKKFVPQTTIKLDYVVDTRVPVKVVIDGENGRRVLAAGQFTVSGNTLTITDAEVIKTLRPGDSYIVDSQPGSIVKSQ